jgi:hypothetical protein
MVMYRNRIIKTFQVYLSVILKLLNKKNPACRGCAQLIINKNLH